MLINGLSAPYFQMGWLDYDETGRFILLRQGKYDWYDLGDLYLIFKVIGL